MAFYTIFIAPGLAVSEYRRAASSGPRAVGTRRREHDEMLRAAGFGDVTELDVTADFERTARASYEGRTRYATELARAEGESSFRERQSDLRAQLRAIESGLLRRSLFVAQR